MFQLPPIISHSNISKISEFLNFFNFLKANSVPTIPPNSIEVSSEDYGRNAIKGTLLLTCWVTGAQVVELEGKRVMFSEFD